MSGLESEVRLMWDERAIERALTKYADALDYDSEPTRFGDSFTETGTWWSSVEGPWGGTSGLRLEGRSAIEKCFADRVASRGPSATRTKHFFRSPRIDVDGDTATAESHFIVLHEESEGPILYAMGWYRDTLIRCDDGQWRIQDRHLGRETVVKSRQGSRVG
jgi:ketosteroid isomerase-like protein